jgi:cytochrome c oxidase subunit 4
MNSEATAAAPSPLDTEDDSLNQAAHDTAVAAGATATAGPVDSHAEHWSDLQYIKLAILLAVVTAVEVALSYMKDGLGGLFLPLLLVLMAFKFMAVVLYFMHLKFDNRLFALMFYLGLGLAISVFSAALCTFQFFSS